MRGFVFTAVALVGGVAFVGACLALLAYASTAARQLPGFLGVIAWSIVFGGGMAGGFWLLAWVGDPPRREHWRALPVWIGAGAAVALAMLALALLSRLLG